MPCSASTSSTCAVSRHDPSRWICSSIACTRLPKSGDEPDVALGQPEHVLVEVLARAPPPRLERARADRHDVGQQSALGASRSGSPVRPLQPAMNGHHAHSRPGSAQPAMRDPRARITLESAPASQSLELAAIAARRAMSMASSASVPRTRSATRDAHRLPPASPAGAAARSAPRATRPAPAAGRCAPRTPAAGSRAASGGVGEREPGRADEPQVAGEVGAPRVLVDHPHRPVVNSVTYQRVGELVDAALLGGEVRRRREAVGPRRGEVRVGEPDLLGDPVRDPPPAVARPVAAGCSRARLARRRGQMRSARARCAEGHLRRLVALLVRHRTDRSDRAVTGRAVAITCSRTVPASLESRRSNP